MTTLDENKRLVSDLWLDQPDAHAQIDRRLQAGHLDLSDAVKLRQFVDDGVMTISLDLEPEFFDAFATGIDRLWTERPRNVAYDPPGAESRRAIS